MSRIAVIILIIITLLVVLTIMDSNNLVFYITSFFLIAVAMYLRCVTYYANNKIYTGGVKKKSKLKSTDESKIISDDYQKTLESELNTIYSNYNRKNFKKRFETFLKKIESKYIEVMSEMMGKGSNVDIPAYPLAKYEIKNQIVLKDENRAKIFNKGKDTRYNVFHNLLKLTIEWAKSKNLNIPDTQLYVWISDSFPWHLDDLTELNEYPIFIQACPVDMQMPLIPDTTYMSFNMHKKYSGAEYDWDQTKKIILDKCSSIKDKQDKYYFKGTSTTKTNIKIREDLEKYARTNNDPPMTVLLDGWYRFEPVYEMCKYKFLLNLPGHAPWSNRLKYILMMDSIVINVEGCTHSLYPKYDNEPYKTFQNYTVDHEDYIEIVMDFYTMDNSYYDDSEKLDELQKLQKNAFETFIKKLKDIYEDAHKNPEKYEKISANSKNKMKKLTNERIYQYMYKAIINNVELLK